MLDFKTVYICDFDICDFDICFNIYIEIHILDPTPITPRLIRIHTLDPTPITPVPNLEKDR